MATEEVSVTGFACAGLAGEEGHERAGGCGFGVGGWRAGGQAVEGGGGAVRSISVGERRRAIVRRHYLGGGAGSPEQVTDALIALHATDPASVYLSVIARSAGTTLEDVSAAMYQRRSLVRWMAMRRTLFVFARDDVPMVQAGVSTPLAATLRRRLVSRLERNGSEPAIEGDVGKWLREVEDRAERALRELGTATGAQLGAAEPGLRTSIAPGAPSERAQNVTTSLLTIMGTEGRIVRGSPTGAWTSRHHRWEPAEHWWPDGLPVLEEVAAQRELARRWLDRFGPATVEDLEWWTGWTKTAVRRALKELPVEDVDLHGEPGIALAGGETEHGERGTTDPVVTLLPALDPTAMGWKRRDWFFGIDQRQVFDTNGNIGPTIWWDGEIIGGWLTTAAGGIRFEILADRGKDVVAAVEDAVSRLHRRLQGAVVVPAFRTPLERRLT